MSSFPSAARSRGNADLLRDGLERKNFDWGYDLRPGVAYLTEGGTPCAAEPQGWNAKPRNEILKANHSRAFFGAIEQQG